MFPLSQTSAQVADVVAKDLATKLRKTFPLRARVVGGGAGEVVLNVGTGEGAAVGQKMMIFKESAGSDSVSGTRESVNNTVVWVSSKAKVSRARGNVGSSGT